MYTHVHTHTHTHTHTQTPAQGQVPADQRSLRSLPRHELLAEKKKLKSVFTECVYSKHTRALTFLEFWFSRRDAFGPSGPFKANIALAGQNSEKSSS